MPCLLCVWEVLDAGNIQDLSFFVLFARLLCTFLRYSYGTFGVGTEGYPKVLRIARSFIGILNILKIDTLIALYDVSL